jgi:excisionase family DNA binding protein
MKRLPSETMPSTDPIDVHDRAIADAGYGPYLTRKEVAKLLGIDKDTVWRWAQEGRLRYKQIGGTGRMIFFRRDLAAVLAEERKVA